MTAVAANELRLYDRGRISPGAAADLVVFDLDRIRDRSTFADPTRPAEGIRHVIVNGRARDRGRASRRPPRPGRVLRGPGPRTPAKGARP